MALLVGAAYWLIHASVDWLWQMAGVTVPVILFVAAGIASVDDRAGVLWPRLERRLKLGAAVGPAAAKQSKGTDTAMPALQRTRTPGPTGPLSIIFRSLLVTLSVVLLVVTGLPYLSLLLQDSATALATTDGVRAVKRAESVRWLAPSDPGPYVTAATIYESAARDAVASQSPDRAGAVFDDLALFISSYEKAINVEPADWTLRYQAGVAVLNLFLAREYVAGLDPGLDYATLIPAVPGLEDWSALLGLGDATPDPGIAAGSSAATAETREVAVSYRDLSQAEVAQLALDCLGAAEEQNPLGESDSRGNQIVRQLQAG